MATELIKNTKRGYNLERMPAQYRTFCLEMMATRGCKPIDAARACGYKNPSVQAARIMKRQDVRAYLGRAQYEREQSLKLDGRRVLVEIQNCMTRNVKRLVDEDGVLLENINDLEDEDAACIDGIEQKVFYDKEGNISYTETKLRLVSKLGAIELAAKHFGLLAPDQQIHQHLHIDWDDLANRSGPVDAVEAKIAEAKDVELLSSTDEDKQRSVDKRQNTSRGIKADPGGNGSTGE